MRWDCQGVSVDDGPCPACSASACPQRPHAQFEGITFHEVLCKSALNKAPNAAMLPFHYTVNGYRGCSHACRYCFARPTHEYLDLDCGTDFDTRWSSRRMSPKYCVANYTGRRERETVALGTNTDPY